MDRQQSFDGAVTYLKIALYYAHDYDLLVLYHTGKLKTVLLESLMAKAAGKSYSFTIDEIPIQMEKQYKTMVRCRISDSGIIRLLGHITTGNKTAFIKSIIRESLVGVEKLYLTSDKADQYLTRGGECDNKKEYIVKKDGQGSPFMNTSVAPITEGQTIENPENENEVESEFTVFDLVVSY